MRKSISFSIKQLSGLQTCPGAVSLTDMSHPRVKPVSTLVLIVDLVIFWVLIVYSCSQQYQYQSVSVTGCRFHSTVITVSYIVSLSDRT